VFAYDHEVSERFPGIRAVVVHATGLSNGHSPQELLDEYQAGQRTVVRKLGDTAIADLPSISAWRRVFAEFGAKPTRYRNAAEALLRRLSKQGTSRPSTPWWIWATSSRSATPCPSPSSTGATSLALSPSVSPLATNRSPISDVATRYSQTLERSSSWTAKESCARGADAGD
jgi:hypothetical protein